MYRIGKGGRGTRIRPLLWYRLTLLASVLLLLLRKVHLWSVYGAITSRGSTYKTCAYSRALRPAHIHVCSFRVHSSRDKRGGMSVRPLLGEVGFGPRLMLLVWAMLLPLPLKCCLWSAYSIIAPQESTYEAGACCGVLAFAHIHVRGLGASAP